MYAEPSSCGRSRRSADRRLPSAARIRANSSLLLHFSPVTGVPPHSGDVPHRATAPATSSIQPRRRTTGSPNRHMHGEPIALNPPPPPISPTPPDRRHRPCTDAPRHGRRNRAFALKTSIPLPTLPRPRAYPFVGDLIASVTKHAPRRTSSPYAAPSEFARGPSESLPTSPFVDSGDIYTYNFGQPPSTTHSLSPTPVLTIPPPPSPVDHEHAPDDSLPPHDPTTALLHLLRRSPSRNHPLHLRPSTIACRAYFFTPSASSDPFLRQCSPQCHRPQLPPRNPIRCLATEFPPLLSHV